VIGVTIPLVCTAKGSEASIVVERRPPACPAFAAIVRLKGEYDVANVDAVERALAPIQGSVLVDLSECGFVDSSMIAVLLRKYNALDLFGFRLDLLVRSQDDAVARTLEISGVSRVLITIVAA
jgi:anti-anti-sigma factor